MTIMNIKRVTRILILVFVLSTAIGSCVIDTVPAGYVVKNCTNDTLLMELTRSGSLEDCWMFLDDNPEILEGLRPIDTTEVYIRGEKVILSNYYIISPDTTTERFYPFNKDTCYIYVVDLKTAKRYTPEEISAMKLYEKIPVTKNDFHDGMFEYSHSSAGRDH